MTSRTGKCVGYTQRTGNGWLKRNRNGLGCITEEDLNCWRDTGESRLCVYGKDRYCSGGSPASVCHKLHVWILLVHNVQTYALVLEDSCPFSLMFKHKTLLFRHDMACNLRKTKSSVKTQKYFPVYSLNLKVHSFYKWK